MHVIIGLGNPGKEYENTRHNAGFLAIDELARQKNLAWEDSKLFKGAFIKDGDTLYLKPFTYMNESGLAVAKLMSYYKLLPKRLGLVKQKDADLSSILTVIHDEIDLPLGEYRWSVGSRSAGHKGVESIIAQLKTKNFRRLRLGVRGAKPEQMPTRDYVLAKFGKDERDIMNKTIAKALREL
jgi:PTH1 family peptidyl-tRNA hydrolase